MKTHKNSNIYYQRHAVLPYLTVVPAKQFVEKNGSSNIWPIYQKTNKKSNLHQTTMLTVLVMGEKSKQYKT